MEYGIIKAGDPSLIRGGTDSAISTGDGLKLVVLDGEPTNLVGGTYFAPLAAYLGRQQPTLTDTTQARVIAVAIKDGHFEDVYLVNFSDNPAQMIERARKAIVNGPIHWAKSDDRKAQGLLALKVLQEVYRTASQFNQQFSVTVVPHPELYEDIATAFGRVIASLDTTTREAELRVIFSKSLPKITYIRGQDKYELDTILASCREGEDERMTIRRPDGSTLEHFPNTATSADPERFIGRGEGLSPT